MNPLSPTSPMEPTQSTPSPESVPADVNVMVVDDTPANLKLLDELLRRQGYGVRLFPRGALAIKAAAAQAPARINPGRRNRTSFWVGDRKSTRLNSSHH